MKFVEFHLEKQGRPASRVALDMETRAPSIPPGTVSGTMLQASYTTSELENNYTAADVTVILVDATAGQVTITLPAAVSSSGRYYYIKKLDGSANRVVVKPDVSAEKIDGEDELRLTLQYGFVQVVCSGVEAGDSYWHIIGGVSVKLEDLLTTLMEDQTSVLAAIREILVDSKLHLASLSDADVTEHD